MRSEKSDALMVESRTLYPSFEGYCLHCARPVGDKPVHYAEDCDLSGVEERMPLLNLAVGIWLDSPKPRKRRR